MKKNFWHCHQGFSVLIIGLADNKSRDSPILWGLMIYVAKVWHCQHIFRSLIYHDIERILSDSFSHVAITFCLLSITKSSLGRVCFRTISGTQREYCTGKAYFIRITTTGHSWSLISWIKQTSFRFLLLLVIQVIWNIIDRRFQIVRRFLDKQIFIGNYSSYCQKSCALQRLNFSLSLSYFLVQSFQNKRNLLQSIVFPSVSWYNVYILIRTRRNLSYVVENFFVSLEPSCQFAKYCCFIGLIVSRDRLTTSLFRVNQNHNSVTSAVYDTKNAFGLPQSWQLKLYLR